VEFGDPVTVKTSTGSCLAVFLWRPEGHAPAIFLNGRAVHLELDAILTLWTCRTCHGTKLFWGVRIESRCAVCQPPSTKEKEFIMAYAIGAIRHLADQLDAQAGKLALYRMLDEAVLTGDLRQLTRVSLEGLAGILLLKHGGD
jgi:hypothetical protein